MGIPSYFKHVITKYRAILTEYESTKIHIDNLYLDSNSIIYDAVRSDRVKSSKNIEEDILIEVVERIKNYITVVRPANKVYIAFDGVAPVAKMSQQRTRRYKGQVEKILHKTISLPQEELWDTVAITPGTIFMDKLIKYIKKQFMGPKKYNVKDIIISGPDEPGEGEHKIFDYVRTHPTYHEATATVIYGLDADLIMLSLNHLRIAPKLYLFRETPHFIKNIDRSLSPDRNYLLDIPAMAEAITIELNDGDNIKGEQQKQRIYDYIFICFMLGNDFLPHFPALNIRTDGISRITTAYKQTISAVGNITKDNEIIWKNMRHLINILSVQEESYIQREHGVRDKQAKSIEYGRAREDPLTSALSNLPIVDRRKELYINPFEQGWQGRYYKILLNSDRTDASCKLVSINYMEGLEWTFKYYNTGCADWAWKYKYNYPPLLQDLLTYIPHVKTQFIPENTSVPVPASVQLAYVLPPNCMHLLPLKMKTHLSQRADYMNSLNTIKVEYSYCRYFWEGHIECDSLDIEELKAIVA